MPENPEPGVIQPRDLKESKAPFPHPGKMTIGKESGNIRNGPILLPRLLVLMLSISVILFPVSARTMAGGVGNPYGIEGLWPVHAALMTGGIACFFIAMGVVRFGKKTRWWYRAHRSIALTGVALAIGALAVAFMMVANSGQPQFQYLHSWIGAITIAMIIATPVIMVFRMRIARRGWSPFRLHRWAGFTAVALMAVNILLGLSMMRLI